MTMSPYAVLGLAVLAVMATVILALAFSSSFSAGGDGS